MKYSLVCYVFAFATALALFAGGCTAGRSNPDESAVTIGSYLMQRNGFPLPPPNAIIRDEAPREASTWTLSRLGKDFEPGVTQRLAANGDDARFTPDWQVPQDSFSDIAYGTWMLDLTGYSGKQVLQFEFSDAPQHLSDIWIGFAYWGKDRWDWRPLPDNSCISFVGLELLKYVDLQDKLAIAVVVLGNNPAALHEVHIGDPARGDWWKFGRDLHNSRRSPYPGPATAHVAWHHSTGGTVLSSPVLDADNTVYVGSVSGSSSARMSRMALSAP